MKKKDLKNIKLLQTKYAISAMKNIFMKKISSNNKNKKEQTKQNKTKNKP